MRILSLIYHNDDELGRIFIDAGTPPVDRRELIRFLRTLDEAHDPRTLLRAVIEAPGLLGAEHRSSSSGYRYGMFLVDMGHAADTIAYWRHPPLYVDPKEPRPHGYSREHALQRARIRLKG